MDRDTVGRLALAFLGILATGLAVASLSTTRSSMGSSAGLEGTGERLLSMDGGPGFGFPVEFVVFALAVFFLLGVLAVLRHPLAFLAETVRSIGPAVGVLALLGLLYLLSESGGRGPAEGVFGNASAGSGLGAGGGEGPGVGTGRTFDPFTSDPLLVLLGVLGVAVVGAVGVVLATRSAEPDPPDHDGDDGTSAPLAAVGRVAEEAAAAIGTSTAVDNEVYRAWKEMTERLDVDQPQSSTPGEFATAAAEAGMNREHVEDLRRLFEAVRYGGYEPTPERERQARETFRRIAEAYTGEEP